MNFISFCIFSAFLWCPTTVQTLSELLWSSGIERLIGENICHPGKMADTTEAESWTSHIAPFSSLFEDHFMWTFPPSISIFSSWLCMIWIVPRVSLAKNATSFAQVHLAYWSTWKHTIIKKIMADLNVSSVDAFLSMPVAWLLTKKLMRWAPFSAQSAPEHCPMQWR